MQPRAFQQLGAIDRGQHHVEGDALMIDGERHVDAGIATAFGVDGTLTYEGFWEAVAKLYANGRDLKDPQLSPVYGDFNGFPPTYLVTGTRDLFLSNTVRVQQKLLQAGVPTQLEVEEGQYHLGYFDATGVDAPEGVELYSHVGQFFDAHLGH